MLSDNFTVGQLYITEAAVNHNMLIFRFFYLLFLSGNQTQAIMSVGILYTQTLSMKVNQRSPDSNLNCISNGYILMRPMCIMADYWYKICI